MKRITHPKTLVTLNNRGIDCLDVVIDIETSGLNLPKQKRDGTILLEIESVNGKIVPRNSDIEVKDFQKWEKKNG